MFTGQAIVISPLLTIQMQMKNVCEGCQIPYLDLSSIAGPSEIAAKLEELDPKIILCSIEDISDNSIQAQLQYLDVSYIAVDECQVPTPRTYSLLSLYFNHRRELYYIIQGRQTILV